MPADDEIMRHPPAPTQKSQKVALREPSGFFEFCAVFANRH
jgi:hypothetical protein